MAKCRGGSIGEEVEDIAELWAIGGVEFGIVAMGAGYGGEFAVLYVEYFAPEAAGGADLAGLAVFVGVMVKRVAGLDSN